MAKDSGSYAGHGESAPKPKVGRGTFEGVGTYAQLSDDPKSADKKNPIKHVGQGSPVGS